GCASTCSREGGKRVNVPADRDCTARATAWTYESLEQPRRVYEKRGAAAILVQELARRQHFFVYAISFCLLAYPALFGGQPDVAERASTAVLHIPFLHSDRHRQL